MKKYNSVGELFMDYRTFNGLSQADFAASLHVDLRTIQRWEKDITLIKPEKEEDIVLATLMPYQLIRNLNAAVPIPTYYNFKTRKYSLSQQSNSFPKVDWYLDQIDITSDRLRTIDLDLDFKHLEQFIDSQKRDENYVNKELIREAVRLLPELNYVFIGKSGYYAGHCIVLPISPNTHIKLRNKEISNRDLRAHHLVNYKSLGQPIFYRFDITGDCNDTVFYIMSKFFRFFRDIENKNYLMCGYTERDDNYNINQQIGLRVIWEDKDLQNRLHLDYPPRFFEGDFNKYLENL
ncbi:helix-turn-helix domain-containing protein [Hanstruepera marina]|uniref:helix-turn-helix domain-containing protein n=1 Tax=Hanstruepera marina TaxID=2873265 RepID=UPI001CA66D66|nr:helix-turn-helix transcriptional regulator [Hanstruepera marina]